VTRGLLYQQVARAAWWAILICQPPQFGIAEMLLNRNEIREDKYFDLLTEAILERDQPRTTDLFSA